MSSYGYSEQIDVLGDKYEIVSYMKKNDPQKVLRYDLPKEEPRYHVIDKETGEVIDNCDGHGYYTYEKAYNGFKFKNSSNYMNLRRQKRIERVNRLTDKYPDFAMAMDRAFLGDNPPWESLKEVSVEQVDALRKEYKVNSDLNANQILDAWKCVLGLLMKMEMQPDGTMKLSENGKETKAKVKEKLAVTCELYIDKEDGETNKQAARRLAILLEGRICDFKALHVSYKPNCMTEKKFWRIIDSGGDEDE